ncbi:hypothetical protein C8J57DRAFT_132537 [Mycena rebaudengoi]|nr:hypothetical protein C8J57DRAFT_132537 [Mycena rebaudengoi]
MRVPSELVDAIIDKVAVLDNLTAERRALRACSLTARSFLPRSQLHLFAAITFRHDSLDMMKFDRLLAESPHIGELYVKYFALQLEGQTSPHSHNKTIVVPRILRLLPGLTHVFLDFDCDDDQPWESQSDLLKTGVQAACSLHSLRSLCLANLHFANVSELESLLSHAIGLKALVLDDITFSDSSVWSVDLRREPRVVIESLTLDTFDAVDAMVSSFSTVDIKHLQSLVLVSTPMFALLKVNAQTLQKVRIAFSEETPFDLDILEGNQTLRSIDVMEVDGSMAPCLRLFGPLGHLKALKTISLHFVQAAFDVDNDRNEVDWQKLNTSLTQAGDGFEAVFVSAYSETDEPPDLAYVKQRLPSVAGKISLAKEGFSRDYTFKPHL